MVTRSPPLPDVFLITDGIQKLRQLTCIVSPTPHSRILTLGSSRGGTVLAVVWCGVSKVILPRPRKKQLVLPDKLFLCFLSSSPPRLHIVTGGWWRVWSLTMGECHLHTHPIPTSPNPCTITVAQSLNISGSFSVGKYAHYVISHYTQPVQHLTQ